MNESQVLEHGWQQMTASPSQIFSASFDALREARLHAAFERMTGLMHLD
jgi:hypothetical protein